MRLRRIHEIAVVALVLALTSCRGCREEGPESIAQLAPEDAGLTFTVPSLAAFVTDLEAFTARATRKAGAGMVKRMRDSLQQQYGIDLLDAKAYATWGIDTTGALIVFTEGARPQPLLALTVKEDEAFDTALKSLISKVDGASKVNESTVNGFKVLVAGRPFGDEVVPVLRWTHVGRFALIGPAESNETFELALQRLAAKPKDGAPRRSLRDDPLYKELVAKVPAADAELFVRGAAASALMQSGPGQPLSAGAITSFKANAEGAGSDTFLKVEIPGLDKALAGPAPADLAGRVESDASFALLSRNARSETLSAVRNQQTLNQLLDQALAPLAKEVGLNPETEILPLLAGPLTLSVHVADLSSAPAELQQRSLSKALDFVHVVVTAEVKDAAAMQKLLARSQEELGKRGVKVNRRVEKIEGTNGSREVTIFAPETGRTERLAWAVYDNMYVYAAGAGRLGRELMLLAGKGDSLKKPLEGSVAGKLASEPGASVMVLRAGMLAEAASKVQLNDQQAMGLNAIIGSALELLKTIGDVAVSFSAEPGGLRIKAREQLQ